VKRAWSVLAALGASLVLAGVLPSVAAHAQTPPPSAPPDLGLPPVTTRTQTTATGGDSTRQRSISGDESFGASFVQTFTKPGGLLGALTLLLVLGVGVAAVLRLTRTQRGARRRGSLPRSGEGSLAWQRAQVAEPDRQDHALLARVSDGMRTSVTQVMEFVDVVRGPDWRELPESRRHDVLDRASSSIHELDRIVGQLCDFSQLDSGRVAMTPRPVLVAEAVERVLTDLGPVLADHDVFLDIPDGLATLADDAAFHEVLTNVVDNAAKFSPAGRRIIISATRVDGAVDISVADEGGGITPEEQALIFDPFYQSSHDGEPRRGLGLGLTIARRFTERQDGQIAVVSEVGLGSTFWITMPVAAGPARRFQNRHHNVASRSGTPPRPRLPLPDLRSPPAAGS
jgi:signal transduction histidine kinase